MLDQKYLDEIRERCEAARPGPWRAVDDNAEMPQEYMPFWVICDGESYDDDSDWFSELHVGDFETALFIAHARQDIPALLAEVERLRTELEAAVQVFAELTICAVCKHDGYCEASCGTGGSCCYEYRFEYRSPQPDGEAPRCNE